MRQTPICPAEGALLRILAWHGAAGGEKKKKSFKLDGEDEAAHGSGNAFSGTSGASWCRCVDGCAPNKAEGSTW